MAKPLILVVNDDGHEAAGIHALAEVARQFGEVCVVSPNIPQSGMGHAITMNTPLRIYKMHEEPDFSIYRTNGTPADCVKLAEKIILKDRRIDLVVSGINHGSNSAISIIYSGTMAAVLEACFDNIPAIGFSLLDHSLNADFSASKIIAKNMIEKVLKDGLPSHTGLNINIPKLPFSDIKGIKITRQAAAFWEENLEPRMDVHGRNYYWYDGDLRNEEPEAEDTDEWALAHHYVSVQPVQFDLTAYHHLQTLKPWEECFND